MGVCGGFSGGGEKDALLTNATSMMFSGALCQRCSLYIFECHQQMRCLWLCVSDAFSSQQQTESEDLSVYVSMSGQPWLTNLQEIALEL